MQIRSEFYPIPRFGITIVRIILPNRLPNYPHKNPKFRRVLVGDLTTTSPRVGDRREGRGKARLPAKGATRRAQGDKVADTGVSSV